MARLKSEERFRRLLEHVCAYCGRLKSERPPEWCVRAHEVHEAEPMLPLGHEFGWTPANVGDKCSVWIPNHYCDLPRAAHLPAVTGPDVEGERPKWELTLKEYHAIRRERDRFGMALSSARSLIREMLREGKFNGKLIDRARAILKDLDSDARSNDDGGMPDGC